ncbi:DUF1836 domain-containing protein, partial [Christensenellaceae bacterium OttesenSCG-928-M15]|nr:DUF1836 domain-containing protein [Christensenellaceae bacterium OttesenSCG-928-M15]
MKLTAKTVKAFHLPRWKELPALALYMDQLVIVLQETIGLFVDEKEPVVTRSMVNNYVKQKLISPPEKKKYGRNHLAALIVVNLLKRVFSMSEITEVIRVMIDVYGMEASYNMFCDRFEGSMQSAFLGESEALITVKSAGDPVQIALDAGIAAFIGKLLVVDFLERAKEKEE